MSSSTTKTETNTYTEPRARYVLGKIKDDFINIANRGFETVKWEDLNRWHEDISFVMHKQALYRVQLKFTWDGKEAAIDYEVSADNTIQVDTDSSGEDLFQIPKHAKVNITIRKDNKNTEVSKYLADRGWTNTGKFLEGDAKNAGGYSQGGFGTPKKTIGL